MRVLYHHRTQGRGAEGVHVGGVVKALGELGHATRVLSPPGVGREDQAPASDIPRRRSPAARLWSWISLRAPQSAFETLEILYNLYSYVRVTQAIRGFRPDVVYDRYCLFNLGCAAACRREGVPLVTEVNDAAVIQRSRELRLTRLARGIERRVLERSTLVVTVSGAFRDLLCRAHGLDPTSVVVTPNAVDPQRFAPQDGRALRERLGLGTSCVLGVVGGFVSWHGLDHLLESVAPLIRGPHDLRILFVGDGPVRGAVEALARRLGLTDHVRFTGIVPASEVPAHIAAMDVCLMPDSNVHGSPIKIFEYMAMGKAVVAPRYAPIEEVIDDGDNGVLFRPRDREDLRRVVEGLVADPAWRLRLGQSARLRVLARHTWKDNVLVVLAALEDRGRLGKRVVDEAPYPT